MKIKSDKEDVGYMQPIGSTIFLKKEDNPWIKCSEELPPCDGEYEITYELNEDKFNYICLYDGVGFYFKWENQEMYLSPYCWRFAKPKEKRYGKVK